MKTRRGSTPISLKQLYQFSLGVSAEQRILHSSEFLYHEVPTRLNVASNLLRARKEELNQISLDARNNVSMVLDRLLEEYEGSSSSIMNECQEPNDISKSEKFSKQLWDVERRVGEGVTSLLRGLQGYLTEEIQKKEKRKSFEEELGNSSRALTLGNDILNRVNYSWICLRVLLGEHNYLFNAYKKHRDDRNGFRSSPPSLVNPNCNVAEIVNAAGEDARALFVEKLGESPSFEVKGTTDATMVCLDSHLHFILMEVMKNSMAAVLQNHKTTPGSDCPPVEVTISHKWGELGIKVSDSGGGIPKADFSRIFDFYYTTIPQEAPTYTYSGGFGAPLMGLGCGLPLARLYSKYMGGDITIASLPGMGTDAVIRLDKMGVSGDRGGEL